MGVVVCTCHPELYRMLRSGRSWVQAVRAKNFAITNSMGKKLGVTEPVCHPSDDRQSQNRRFMVQANLDKK
jgi:hypothetical protein